MENNKDSREQRSMAASHPPTDHNPYPYPIQKENKKGWLRALLALIIVAVVVTLVCLVVGIYDHHQNSLNEEIPVENVSGNH